MKRNVIIGCCAVLVLSLCLASCNDLRRAGKYTGEVWEEYVVPRPEVDLDTEYLGDYNERRLAVLVKPVDEPLEELLYFLDGTDKEPESDWYETLFFRFPWVSGVKVVDTVGYTKYQFPQSSLKTVDMDAILALGLPDPEAEEPAPAPETEDGEEAYVLKPWDDRSMRSYCDVTDLGPEVYLAYPTFEDNKWAGLIIVHFDPGTLLQNSSNPEELIIVSPGQVLSAGRYGSEASALAAEDWEDILTSSISGTWDIGGSDYYWVARTLGHSHLIYAAGVEGENLAATE